MQKEITEQEDELIEAIRNYQRSFPNGKREMLRFAKEIFDELTSRY